MSAARPPAGPIAVIGASRGCGLQCVLYLARRKITCRAVARDAKACEKAVHGALAEGQHQHVTFVTADVTKPATLTPAVRGCAGAIFAATATAGWRLPFASDLEDTPPHVDFEGAVASATAAAAEGVPRFVLISSASITQPSSALHLARNSLMGRIMDWKLLGEQGAAKVYETVRQSTARDLSLTIVRPGYLTDDPPGGARSLLVDTGEGLTGSLPRADLAALCCEAALNDDAKGLVFEVVAGVQGGNYPVCPSYDSMFQSLKHGYLPVGGGSVCGGGANLRGLCGGPEFLPSC